MPSNTSQTRNTIKLDDFRNEAKETSTINSAELINLDNALKPEQPDGSARKQKVSNLVSTVLHKITTQSSNNDAQTEARHDTYVYQGRVFRLSDSEENELYTR